MGEFSSRRLTVFLRRTTWFDRAAAAVISWWVVERLAAGAGRNLPFEGLAGFLSLLALVYFAIRLLPWFRTRILWRLRNRLIVAYVLIAVVPVVLLLTIGGLAAYGIYLELGAHLLHDGFQERINTISADADAISAAIEHETKQGANARDESILSRPEVAAIIADAQTAWPEIRVHVNPGESLAKAGDGRNFSDVIDHHQKLWFAAARVRGTGADSFSVVVEAPLTPAILDELPSELGPIQIFMFRPSNEKSAAGLKYQTGGQSYESAEQVTSRRRALVPPVNRLDFKVNGASLFDVTHWEAGKEFAKVPVLASFTLRPSAVNGRLLTSVGALGPILVTVLTIVGVIFLSIEVVALATGVVLTRTITRAVEGLYEATLHIRRGDFSHRVRVHKRDQLGALGDSFNEMTSSIAELIEEQKKRQRLENELSIAREVQEQLFPRSLPSLPGLQLGAICRPARTVSGDYYDFIRLGPLRLGIALADISGKGISAALLMASLQASLRSQATLNGHGGTAELVSRLNQHLFRNTSDDRYATFFYAVYDEEARTITYTNAGHLAPFFLCGGEVQKLDEGGTVVGLFEDYPYTQGVLKAAPGSLLVAFSDGLTEPENVYGEEFGMERLKQEILRHENSAPQQLAENLVVAAEQWAGTPDQADDITVVVARMG
jgi:sigma-B regulation protein RsbU (phosphoserine phosphatase)